MRVYNKESTTKYHINEHTFFFFKWTVIKTKKRVYGRGDENTKRMFYVNFIRTGVLISMDPEDRRNTTVYAVPYRITGRTLRSEAPRQRDNFSVIKFFRTKQRLPRLGRSCLVTQRLRARLGKRRGRPERNLRCLPPLPRGITTTSPREQPLIVSY